MNIDEDLASKVIIQRKSESHKGNYGHLVLIGGNHNYGGAIIMAAESAVSSGAGLTVVATHSSNLSALHSRVPEAMFLDWRDNKLFSLVKNADVVLCGPGLGTDELALQLLTRVFSVVSEDQTLILDASALDLISQNINLITKIKAGLVILTPHQMEWQRVSKVKIPFQTDSANITALKQLFVKNNAILVLKSNKTHVYDTMKHVYVNTVGNPGMATGGMGDTLSGIIAAFVGQFGANLNSVLAAVYCHSKAGDIIYQDNYVVRPTEISALMPKLMKRLSIK